MHGMRIKSETSSAQKTIIIVIADETQILHVLFSLFFNRYEFVMGLWSDRIYMHAFSFSIYMFLYFRKSATKSWPGYEELTAIRSFHSWQCERHSKGTQWCERDLFNKSQSLFLCSLRLSFLCIWPFFPHSLTVIVNLI